MGARRTLTGIDTQHGKVLQHHSVLIDAGEQPEHDRVWLPRLVICNPLHLNLAAAAGLESKGEPGGSMVSDSLLSARLYSCKFAPTPSEDVAA